MELSIAKNNLSIFEGAGNRNLNLDVDSKGEIFEVTTLLGRFWKWIRNLDGSVRKEVDKTINESITTVYWSCQNDNELNALVVKERNIKQLRPETNFILPTMAPWIRGKKDMDSKMLDITSFLDKARSYAPKQHRGETGHLLAYITKTLNNVNFQKDPHKFMEEWKVSLDNMEGRAMPLAENQAFNFFRNEVLPNIKATEDRPNSGSRDINFFMFAEVKNQAAKQFKGQPELLAYITKILNNVEFQKNPQQFMKDWEIKRGNTKEIRRPEDDAIAFFKYRVIPDISKTQVNVAGLRAKAKSFIELSGYSEYGNEISEYIERVLNDPAFQQDPKLFMDNWKKERGRTEEFRVGEDSAMMFFDKELNFK